MRLNTRDVLDLSLRLSGERDSFKPKRQKVAQLMWIYEVMATKTALITGITGQDGAILAKILLEKGYEVHGMRPYSAVPDEGRLTGLEGLRLHYGDMMDSGSLINLIDKIKPDEIYNLAALSHVGASFEMPEVAANINALGTLRLLEALRVLDGKRHIKFYQASSSEMYGRTPAPQNEESVFAPCNPYATAKLFAYWSVRNYREAYGIFAANGILFNHESPIRGEEFVTRKITKAVHNIIKGHQEFLTLGNLEAKRDWGHAHDYMRGVWQILQFDKADDFVLATGKSHSVRDFVERAFACVDIALEWQGTGLEEQGLCAKTGKIYVKISPEFFRPQEVSFLQGNASKAQKILGWSPQISFEDLVAEMMKADA